jgi:hypothetical protein
LTAHKFFSSVSAGGVLTATQPDISDLTGTITAAQCPAGTTSALGCLEVGGGLSVSAGIVQLATVAGTTHQWFSSVTSGGVLTPSQPAAADLSNGVSGSGAVVLVTSPALITPALGVATATSVNKVAFTTPASLATITLATGSTLTTGGSLTATGTGPTTLAFPSASATFTFPTTSGGDTIPGLKASNIFTGAQQTVNLNTAAFPSSVGSPLIAILAADGTQTSIDIIAAGNNPVINFFRANNTITSPSTMVNTSGLMLLQGGGWNGSAYKAAAAAVTAVASETWTGATNGAYVNIIATPNGSTVNQTEATFQSGASIGATTPQGIGTMNVASKYYAASTAGVTCATGSPTSSFAAVGGIVTHC